MLRIVADENIVALDSYFSPYGELKKLPGRDICRSDVFDADALLVRSITPVNKALLDGSAVRFVATATSGTDHLDLEYLQESGIFVAEARGSNANAVVEYCFSALFELVKHERLVLAKKTVAVIGAGQVGSRFAVKLCAMGLKCIVHDPFLDTHDIDGVLDTHGILDTHSFRRSVDLEWGSLEQALKADVISFHTPLTDQGPFPTFHLLNRSRIENLAPGTVLLNTSRGSVIDTEALEQRLRKRRDLLVVLDVWENEPEISNALLGLVDLASPHIAGYSVEAKLAASRRNYRDFLSYFGLRSHAEDDTPDLDGAGEKGEPLAQLTSDQGSAVALGDSDRIVAEYVTAVLSVCHLSGRFRALAKEQPGASVFDRIRKDLLLRREFSHYSLDPAKERMEAAVVEKLNILGFRVSH